MKKVMSFLLVIVMGLGLAGCNVQPKMGAGNQVIAESSEGDKILLRDFLYALGSYKAQTEYMYGQMGDFSSYDFVDLWNGAGYTEGKTMFDDLKDSVMNTTQTNAVLYKLAKAEGLSYDEAEWNELKTTLDTVVTNMNSMEKTGERAFYETYYVTKDEVLEADKINMTATAYRDHVKEGIDATDDEISAYYGDASNQSAIEEIQKVTIAHILIKSDDTMTDEERTAAKELAEDILERAKAGEDFGAMAAEYSEDGGSNTNNGEYTITRSENFVTEFMDWTFADDREPGDMDIVETSYGYHVMKLVSVQGFEEMKDSIKDLVINDKYNTEIGRILSDNAVEWTVDEELYNSIDVTYGQSASSSPSPETLPDPSEETEVPSEEPEPSPSASN